MGLFLFSNSITHLLNREKKSVKKLVNALLKLKKEVDRGYRHALKQEKSYQKAIKVSQGERIDVLLRNRKR